MNSIIAQLISNMFEKEKIPTQKRDTEMLGYTIGQRDEKKYLHS